MLETQRLNGSHNLISRLISSLLVFVFSLISVVPPGTAEIIMPSVGTLVSLSPVYTPALVKGLQFYPNNPLRFDFIVDAGDDVELTESVRKTEYQTLVKYFLTALTVPEDELWVNLSPYEQDRIVPDALSVTALGRDLLAQDYILKQITASLIYPEEELGQKFWDRVYKKAQYKFGTSDIPLNTFNKVWIVPEAAVVYENGNSAFVAESKLKVMLEEDYEASARHRNLSRRSDIQEDVSAEIIREIIIPEIEKEVNEGKNFAQLRQIYNATILATWFKQNLKNNVLGKIYVDQNKINGIDIEDKQSKEKIYTQYLQAFQKGVYDYIKEEYDPLTQQVIPRKYFSGGTNLGEGTLAVMQSSSSAVIGRKVNFTDAIDKVTVDLNPQLESFVKPEALMISEASSQIGAIERLESLEEIHVSVNNWAKLLAAKEVLVYLKNLGYDSPAYIFLRSIPELLDMHKINKIFDGMDVSFMYKKFLYSKQSLVINFSMSEKLEIYSGRPEQSLLFVDIPEELLKSTINPVDDEVVTQLKEELAINDEPVIVVGSANYSNDADHLLKSFAQVSEGYPHRLIIVPRTLYELIDWQRKAKDYGFESLLRYSQDEEIVTQGSNNAKIIINNTFGELNAFYALGSQNPGSFALIGNTFYPNSEGHNPLEPIQLGLPVIFGPGMTNNSRAAKLVKKAGAGYQFKRANLFKKTLLKYMSFPELLVEMQNNAPQVLLDKEQAILKQLEPLKNILPEVSSSSIDQEHSYFLATDQERDDVFKAIVSEHREFLKGYFRRFVEATRKNYKADYNADFDLEEVLVRPHFLEKQERGSDFVFHEGLYKDEKGIYWILKRKLFQGEDYSKDTIVKVNKNDPRREKFADLLMKNIANLAEIRLVKPQEINGLFLDRPFNEYYFVRVVTENNMRAAKLPHRDLHKAFSALFVANIFMGKFDQHANNVGFARGVSVSLDQDVVADFSKELMRKSNSLEQFVYLFLWHYIYEIVEKMLPNHSSLQKDLKEYNPLTSISMYIFGLDDVILQMANTIKRFGFGQGIIAAEGLNQDDIEETILAIKQIENISDLAIQAGFWPAEVKEVTKHMVSFQQSLGSDVNKVWQILSGEDAGFDKLDQQVSSSVVRVREVNSDFNLESGKGLGGIDLSEEAMNIQTRGVGMNENVFNDVPIAGTPCRKNDLVCQHRFLNELETLPISGFAPVIIQITPIKNVPLLLGFADAKEVYPEAMPLHRDFAPLTKQFSRRKLLGVNRSRWTVAVTRTNAPIKNSICI